MMPPPAPCAPPPVCLAAAFGSAPPPAFDEEFEDISEDGLDKNLLSLAYCVEGRVLLPSGGVVHKVSIAALGFVVGLKYVCVPRKTNAAFIE